MKKQEINNLFLTATEEQLESIMEELWCKNSFSLQGVDFTIVCRENLNYDVAVYQLTDGTRIMWESPTMDSWDTEEFNPDYPESFLDFTIVKLVEKLMQFYIDEDVDDDSGEYDRVVY